MKTCRTRGFTLVELLAVVAMVGILAVIAMVGYQKYLRYAHAAEATVVMQGIAAGQEAHRSEALVYLNCSDSPTDYYPHATPDRTLWDWSQPSHPDAACWQQLSVTYNKPVRFVYSVVAGRPGETPQAIPDFGLVLPMQTKPWFVIHAAGDQDADGDRSSFWVSSVDDEIRSKNETE